MPLSQQDLNAIRPLIGSHHQCPTCKKSTLEFFSPDVNGKALSSVRCSRGCGYLRTDDQYEQERIASINQP
jgi:hypothetical protein